MERAHTIIQRLNSIFFVEISKKKQYFFGIKYSFLKEEEEKNKQIF